MGKMYEKIKNKTAKIKPNPVKGYKPDAGINTPAFVESHYWLSVPEWAQSITLQLRAGIQPLCYSRGNTKLVEFTFAVDVMDKDGKEHQLTQTEDGYAATVCLTSDQCRELAEQIEKGAQGLRISGVPNGEIRKVPTGDEFMVIDFKSAWAPGNDSGYMTYMFNVDNSMCSTSSTKLGIFLRDFANQLELA